MDVVGSTKPPFHYTHFHPSSLHPRIYELSCSCHYHTVYQYNPQLSWDDNFRVIASVLDSHWREMFWLPYWEWVRERFGYAAII